MKLALMGRVGRRGSGARVAGSAVGAAMVVAVALGGALGGASLCAQAQQADPFTVTVKVDATADTVIKAREMARLDGERRALAAVADQLSGGQLSGGAPVGGTAAGDVSGKLAKLDDKAITGLVASFEVAGERMSAVRYLADYTFHFRPAEVRRVLRSAGIAIAEAPSAPAKPIVVLPVYQTRGEARLWEDPNPWRAAWEERTESGPSPRLVVPLGDAADVATVDADKAQAGDGAALAAIAGRNGGGDAVVLLATIRGSPDNPSAVDVTARRYHAGRLIATHVEPVAGKPGEGEDDLLHRAVTAVAADIDSGWKKQPGPGYDQLGTLTAVLPISGLDDWLAARQRLAAVPAIRKITLVALSRQEATIEIGYGGSIDDLKASLAGISFDLVHGDPLWRLAHTGRGETP